ncbi:hypothetical protein [Clostridium botulinum]|nr:hypothetical protein [Clostridium botulinum]
MQCDICDHQIVCILYINHIKVLQEKNIKLKILDCKEYDEVK